MNQKNQPITKKCPFCAEEIQFDALKCKHCGEWLNKQSTVLQETQSIALQYSNAQDPWQLIVLSIITFGIYNIYWFCRNWEHIESHKGLNRISGWGRAIGLFIPIYNIVLIYGQFRNIRDLAMKAGCKADYSPGWITFGYMLLEGLWSYALIKSVESYITILALVIGFLAMYLLAIVQKTLNDFWKKEQPGFIMRTKFSYEEIVALVIGGFFWILRLIQSLS